MSLLEDFGRGLQGAGEVLSPQVYEKNAIERRELAANALPNMLRNIQLADAQKKATANAAFVEGLKKAGTNPGMTASAMFDSVKDIPPEVWAESPIAHQFVETVHTKMQREHAVEQDRQRLQAAADRLNKPIEHVVNGKLVRSYADGRTETIDLPAATPAGGNIRYSISPKDYTPASLKKYSETRNVGDLVAVPRGSASTGGGAGEPTKGWVFYKDKEGALFRFNANAGLVEKQLAPGKWEQSDQLPEGLTKLGNLAGGGALNQRYSGRVIGAANEGFAALNTISRLNDPNSGIFSTKAMGGAEGKNILAGAFSTERVKRYNATIAGLAVEIATAQNQGMIPNETQIAHVEQAITISPTDDDVTKRYRVALAARYLRKGLEVSMDLANPDQKKRAEGLLKQLEKIPDPDDIETEKGPGMFPGAKGGAAPLKNSRGWELHVDAKGNKAFVSPDGKQYEEVK